MPAPLPPAARALAIAQHGAIGRQQLLRWMTSGAIAGLVSRGSLERLERGVYRVAGSARPPEQELVAALLRARPAARASGPAVLGLLGIDSFQRTDPFIVVTGPERSPTGVTFMHRVGQPWEGRARIAGISCCSAAAVLVEAAHPRWNIADRRLRVAADQLRWRSVLDTSNLLGTIERAVPSHPGARRLVELGRDGLIAESDGERRLAACLSDLEPAPTPQVWIGDRFRVDLGWPDLGLAVEYDGRVDHATSAGRRHDEDRDRELRALGVQVLRFSSADLRNADRVRATVASALLRAAIERDG